MSKLIQPFAENGIIMPQPKKQVILGETGQEFA
jgi:hypothetical protein